MLMKKKLNLNFSQLLEPVQNVLQARFYSNPNWLVHFEWYKKSFIYDTK